MKKLNIFKKQPIFRCLCDFFSIYAVNIKHKSNLSKSNLHKSGQIEIIIKLCRQSLYMHHKIV